MLTWIEASARELAAPSVKQRLAALRHLFDWQPAVLCEDIFDRHAERSANPGEGIDHQPDQRAIAQTGMRRNTDAVEQCARFHRIEHRCLPGRDDVPRPAHRSRGVDRNDLAGDEPVE